MSRQWGPPPYGGPHTHPVPTITMCRRTRDDFAAGKAETDPAKVAELLAKGRAELEVIRRQATISSMYDMGGRKHVMELQDQPPSA